MSDSLRPHTLQPAIFPCPWNSPGKNTGVDCHALLQGISLIQGSNPGLLHCRQSLLPEPPRSPFLVAQMMSSILVSNSMRPKKKKWKKTIKVIWISVIRILLKAIPIALYTEWSFLWSLFQNNDAVSEYLFYFYFMGTGHLVMSLNWLLKNLEWNLWPNSRNGIKLERRFFYRSILCMASYFISILILSFSFFPISIF